MIEHTELNEDEPARRSIRAPRRPVLSYAGSDIARGEVVLRRGTRVSSREIGMLAACGIATVVVGASQSGVLSTGDELVAPAERSRPRGSMTATARSSARDRGSGRDPVAYGAFPDEETALELAMRAALARATSSFSSGGTSKARGTSPIASCRSSASPAFCFMASHSSRANRSPRRDRRKRSPYSLAFRPRRFSLSTPSSRR